MPHTSSHHPRSETECICALEACSAGLGVEVVEPIGGGIIKGVAMYLGAYLPSEGTNAVFIGL